MICKGHFTRPKRYYVDLHYNGERIKIYSHKSGRVLDSFEVATETLDHIRYEIRNHRFDPSKYVKSDIREYLFEMRIDKWYQEKETEARKDNLAWSYVLKIKGYIGNYYKPFFKGHDVRDIRNCNIKEFWKQLPDRLSPKYVRNILDGLENFFNVLLADELIEKKPAFPQIALQESCVKWCTRETQDAILNAIPERHRAIFFFLTRQGLRPAEAVAVKWEDIDLTNGIITIKRGMSNRRIVEKTKTKKTRPRLLHPEILDLLRSVPRGLPQTPLFVNPNTGRHYVTDALQRLWKKVCADSEVKISLYQATRHSVASMASTGGVDINIIKEVLGHTDIRTTQKYAHVDVLAQSRVFQAQTENRPQTGPGDHSDMKKVINIRKF